jgi:hypothetical protein
MHVASVTLTREGQLDWPVAGDHHCAPEASVHNGLVGIKYTMIAECENHLDHKGFLFDQATADQWMHELAHSRTHRSCERLAEFVGEDILKRIAKVAPHVRFKTFTVVLSPDPYMAKITAVWANTGKG